MEDEFSRITSLIGDPVRSKIMWALLDGRAYTATELAAYANTTPQNISMHLNKLVCAELLNVEKQGRHRYYNYSKPEISYAIEALATLIPEMPPKNKISQADQSIRYCRTCYDHLAGEIGVNLADTLMNRQLITKTDNEFYVTSEGLLFFKSQNIEVELLKKQKRSFARACLDWSERKHHIAGALGAAILDLMKLNGWMRPVRNSRSVIITGKGRQALNDQWGI